MVSVDVLTRRFERLIETHCTIAKTIHDHDVAMQPLAYEVITFYDSATSKLTPPLMIIPSTPILSSTFITNVTMHEDIGQIDDHF